GSDRIQRTTIDTVDVEQSVAVVVEQSSATTHHFREIEPGFVSGGMPEVEAGLSGNFLKPRTRGWSVGTLSRRTVGGDRRGRAGTACRQEDNLQQHTEQ